MCKLKSLYIFITLIFATLLNAQNAVEVQRLQNDLKFGKENTFIVKTLLGLSNILNG